MSRASVGLYCAHHGENLRSFDPDSTSLTLLNIGGLAMSVTTQAIESIRAMIVDGRLEPGDRLPPEQELAEQLGLSRGSLREAVRALAQIKVLDVRRGDGTYVRSLEPGDLLSGMVFALELVQARGLDEV